MNRVFNLSVCFGLLIVLIAVSPVLAITGSWIGPQLVTLTVAAMLIFIPAAPKADVQRSFAIYKPLAITAVLPTIWMLLQLVPVPLGSIDHPVWRSAAAALNEPLAGHVSVDLGYTLRSLLGYLSLISLTFITTVLTRDRDRAETLLFGLCAVTTFIAIQLILFRGSVVLKLDDTAIGFGNALIALTTFGTILNVAFIIRAVERNETRSQNSSIRKSTGLILTGCVGAVVCFAALMLAASVNVILSLAFGMAVICLVVALRRLNPGRWTTATVCAAVLVASAGVVTLRFATNPTAIPLFRFATDQSPDAGGATLRMLSDANWLGGGVGTYQALAALYRDVGGGPGQTVLNTVTSSVLEWGWGGLLIIIVLISQLFILLFRGALLRGRDSFFSASAAACVVIIFCEAFCDASFTGLTVQMLAAIIIGLGLSQTTGRRST